MKLLLVEDDAGIGQVISRGLRMRGYAVAWERCGDGAVRLFGEERYAAALIDLNLPDCDGLEVCRLIRSTGSNMPILVLTARTALEDRLEGFSHGADDYLCKPFAFEELVARVRALTARAASAGQLRFGALTIDRLRRSAAIGSATLALRPREYDLLASLAEAGGALVSRDALLSSVWGDAAEVSDNALDVYVGYVRRRLAAIPAAPLIETVRGKGFRLSAPS